MNQATVPAERVLLGGMLVCPDIAANVFAQGADASYFEDEKHIAIFAAMESIVRDEDIVADEVILGERLKEMQQLEQAGGYAYLEALPEGIPKMLNWEHYLGILSDRREKRRLIKLCRKVLGMAKGGQAVQALQKTLLHDLSEMEPGRIEHGMWSVTAADHNARAFQAMSRGEKSPMGIPSSFDELDAITLGWHPGQVVILGARPKIGKTAIAIQMAHAASEVGHVAYYSFEMSARELEQRMVAQQAEADLMGLRKGVLEPDEWERVQTFRMADPPPIFWADRVDPNVHAIHQHLRAMLHKYPIQLVIVDHIHELFITEHGAGRHLNRNQELTQIMSSLRNIAKKTGIPFLLLAQLNRDVARRGDQPMLSDLRDSGSLEQTADIVLLLHRNSYGVEKIDEPNVQTASLVIAKQRNGPEDSVNLHFWKRLNKFQANEKTSRQDFAFSQMLLSKF